MGYNFVIIITLYLLQGIDFYVRGLIFLIGHDIKSILTSHGVRPTQQRAEVYHYLLTHSIHPSADTIYKALSSKYPVFSRTTIYNSLNVLVEAGLVRIINIRAGEQHFDANTENHGHFLCLKCDKIYDFDIKEDLLSRLCPTGYQPKVGDIYFTGICINCNENEKKISKRS